MERYNASVDPLGVSVDQSSAQFRRQLTSVDALVKFLHRIAYDYLNEQPKIDSSSTVGPQINVRVGLSRPIYFVCVIVLLKQTQSGVL